MNQHIQPRTGLSGKVWRIWESLRGRGAWHVYYWPDGGERTVLLRRTRFRWQAMRWVDTYGAGLPTPIACSPHDLSPQFASLRPLYPYPDRPGIKDS